MSTSKTEYLSALLDDEAGTFEQRRLLDELKQDDELSQTFSRYALIGESLRSERAVVPATTNFLSGIQEAIADEDAHDTVQLAEPSAVTAESRKGSVDSIWKYGMAAAVGALSLGVVMTLQSPPTQQQPTLAVAQLSPSPTVAPAANTAPAESVRLAEAEGREQPVQQHYAQLDAETRGILKQYVAQHLRYASTTAIVPSVRTVSYENDN